MNTETFLKACKRGTPISDMVFSGDEVLKILNSFQEYIDKDHKKELHDLKHNRYNVRLEIRNKEGKLFAHPRAGNFTGFQYEHCYKSYEAMEALMRLQHEELKMLMPGNEFTISASVYNSISQTYMEMAEFRGKHNQFIVLTYK
jgi:hypothetical protein